LGKTPYNDSNRIYLLRKPSHDAKSGLHTSVERNQEFVPNYGERYRNGEKMVTTITAENIGGYIAILGGKNLTSRCS
jgi:hypothetical protein